MFITTVQAIVIGSVIGILIGVLLAWGIIWVGDRTIRPGVEWVLSKIFKH